MRARASASSLPVAAASSSSSSAMDALPWPPRSLAGSASPSSSASRATCARLFEADDVASASASSSSSSSASALARVTRTVVRGLSREVYDALAYVVDTLGVWSAEAQALPRPITSLSKLASSDDAEQQRLFLYQREGRVGGLLRVGYKKLFVRAPSAARLVEAEPMCVLDFFVVPGWQRGGVGRRLFDAMLADCGVEPWQLAYDRPSSKLRGFLERHFSLSRALVQDNNYVVFEDLFERAKIVGDRLSSNAPLRLVIGTERQQRGAPGGAGSLPGTPVAPPPHGAASRTPGGLSRYGSSTSDFSAAASMSPAVTTERTPAGGTPAAVGMPPSGRTLTRQATPASAAAYGVVSTQALASAQRAFQGATPVGTPQNAGIARQPAMSRTSTGSSLRSPFALDL